VNSRPIDTPRCRTSSAPDRFVSLPSDADDRPRSTWNQLKLAGAMLAVGEKRPHGVGLPALDVEQKHVGRIAAVCTENSSSRLPCSERMPTMKNARARPPAG
jgi:hypothetical protein